MKNILITAGGTATAWHLASLMTSQFSQHFRLFVCDINPNYLIPASQLAHRFFQVPLVTNPEYRDHMIHLMRENKIDILVPLVDFDVYKFPSDDAELAALGTLSTSVTSATAQIMQSKLSLSDYLMRHGIPVPKTYSIDEVTKGCYFVKPDDGFGSRGAHSASAEQIKSTYKKGMVIQELCTGPEITVEVFNGKEVRSLCRERIEVKAGVCTKAGIWFDADLHQLSLKLCQVLEMPTSFCYQVMKNPQDEWVITDLNPRMGAGTALCSAYGWSLASASLTTWAQLPQNPLDYLTLRDGRHYVTRVYSEHLMT